MNSFDYNPIEHLNQIIESPGSLDEIPELLAYINAYKHRLNEQIQSDVTQYNTPIALNEDTQELIENIKKIKAQSADTQGSIVSITSSIQELDNCKKNLVLLMTVFKRLQMLIDAHQTLNSIISGKQYKDILQLLSVVKELLVYFKPYRSIDEINRLNLDILKTQNKLVDDIFIDFEDTIVNKLAGDQLIYGCEILELIDSKYKDKLLNWFYNLQLKDIKSIFNNLDEAGSLENLNRRYIYFNNTLANIHLNYMEMFPKEWSIDLELSKIFCTLTKQDLSSQLNNSIPSNTLLDALTKTLDFEKNLNNIFKSNDFNQIILKVFEPYLSIWISEQDKLLNSKFLEFYSISQIPAEYSSVQNHEDFMNVLRINNVPNISNSSIELFKTFQKILSLIIKLSSGSILINLSRLFDKYLNEFNNKILLPMILNSNEALNGIEPIKYLTMVLNTGDYILNNINDLQDRFIKLIDEPYKEKISFETIKDVFIDLINKSMQNLLLKISIDFQFAWRQFTNNNWKNMDQTVELSNYMIDYKQSLLNNCTLILPLVIREGYVRNFCDKLTDQITSSYLNNLKLITPLSIINVEQIMSDVQNLKSLVLDLPLYSNPNFDPSNKNETPGTMNLKSYSKHAENQFAKVDKVLKLLLIPTLPIDNLILNYFQIIGDKSTTNFIKFLKLKGIDLAQRFKYVEIFNLQTSYQNTLIEESPILAAIQDDSSNASTSNITPTTSLKSPEPEVKSPKLLNTNFQNNLKINNIEKNLRDFALTGETHVNKFKNFGKFFRKDNSNE